MTRRIPCLAALLAVTVLLLAPDARDAWANAESAKRWKVWKKDLEHLYEVIEKPSSLKQIFKAKGVDWKKVRKEADKRFKGLAAAAKKRKKDDQQADEVAFYDLLRYVVSQLRDSHAYVDPGKAIHEAWKNAQPQICDAGIELQPGSHGTVIVANTSAARDSVSPLAQRGVQHSATILESVNGTPAAEYMQALAREKYEDEGWQSTMGHALSDAGNSLRVSDDKPLKLVFKTLDVSEKAIEKYLELPVDKREKAFARLKWKTKKVTLKAAVCKQTRNPRNFRFMALPRIELEKTSTSDVWYCRLSSGIGYVGYYKVSKSSREGLREACEALADCPGLILDMRINGGGGDGNVQVFDKKTGAWNKRLAVLIGPRAFSAAETDIWMLQEMRAGHRCDARFLGRDSAGASGDKIRFELPSGFAKGRFVFRHWHGGRSKIEGTGLEPDEIVLQDVVELSQGIDSCIRAAEAWLTAQ